jgi:hypothetical protein
LNATSTDGHVTCTGNSNGIFVECPGNRPDDEKNVIMTCTRDHLISGDPYWLDALTLLLPSGVNLLCVPPSAGTQADCVPTTCADENRTCGEVFDGCGSVLNCGACAAPQTCGGGGQPGVCGTATNDPCDVSTTACLQAHDKPTSSAATKCSTCMANSPCLDPTKLNGSCEAVSGNAMGCGPIFGTMSTVTETQVCLHTLKDILTSGCSWSEREIPCLCGTSDTTDCASAALAPNGAALQDYECDFNTSSIYNMWVDRTVQAFGAGDATALLQCAAEVGCDCSPTPASAGARYWVGGPGNADSASQWSTASGGPPGASVPTSANDVIFDANSGFGTGTNLVSSSNTSTPYVLYAHSITMSQPQTITWGSNVSLNGSGDATLANVSASSPTTLRLSGLQPGNFTPNSVPFGTLSIGNRTITLQSDLVGGFQSFSVSGELDANGHNIYGTGPLQGGTIHLGSGLIQVGSFAATAVDASNTASLEIAAGGTLSAPGATLNLVAFDGNGSIVHEEGGLTIGHATFRAGSTYSFENGQTTTFLNPPVIVGTPATATAFGTTTPGGANAVLSCATSVELEGLLSVSGITASGAGWTATNATIDASSQGWTQTRWTSLSYPPQATCTPEVLLTDGSILCDLYGAQGLWFKLKPDAFGSYQNGQWTTVHTSNFSRYAYPSTMLRDGRYWVAGGELVTDGGGADGGDAGPPDYGTVEIYDPTTDTWTVGDDYPGQYINDGGPVGIRDAPVTILADGRVFCGSWQGGHGSEDFVAYAFDPTKPPHQQWSATSFGSPHPYVHEQGFTLLQDGGVFTIGVETTTPAYIYTPSTGTSGDFWTKEPSPLQPLFYPDLPSGFDEIGGMVVLPSGKVLVLGVASHAPDASSPNHNNIYDPSTGQWANNVPDGPEAFSVPGCGFQDVAACVMPNGKVLTPVFKENNPTTGNAIIDPYVFDPTSNQFAPDPAPPSVTVYSGADLVLPNGQILVQSSPNLSLYTPAGPQMASAAPVISKVNFGPADGTYSVQGMSLNGVTTGCAEGDDWGGLATNYPIVSATNVVSGVTYYFRSYNFDQMAPEPGHSGTAVFAVPPMAPTPPAGAYKLTVSASGARSSIDVLLGYNAAVNCPTMTQNSSATCTITLAQPAPAPGGGLSVQLVVAPNNTQYLTVPSTVLVPAGQTQASFTAQTHAVQGPTRVLITETSGGISIRSVLIINT